MPPLSLDYGNLPSHVAVIMDGNGRWARSHGLPRLQGHTKGVETVDEITRTAVELGIDTLTLYAFSSENWKRPREEVSGLMGLLKKYLESELSTMLDNNIRLRCIGDIKKLPSDVQDSINYTLSQTSANNGLILNLALNYGGRDEIIRATRQLVDLCLQQKLQPQEIDKELFNRKLDTAELSDPDLIIRTGGEKRLSNFLLWQASYSELYFTEINWPSFSRDDFIAALSDYQKRQRRFGKTGEQAPGRNNRERSDNTG
ncbi:MAG: isoprenyl transferase [Thermodesulfobacteriota bacterium]